MPRQTADEITERVQTTDATQTTLKSYTLADGCVANFTVLVAAQNTANGDSKMWQLAFAAKRPLGGAATMAGSVINIVASQGDIGAVTWSATADTNGNDVRIRVTGASATTIQWACMLQFLLFAVGDV